MLRILLVIEMVLGFLAEKKRPAAEKKHERERCREMKQREGFELMGMSEKTKRVSKRQRKRARRVTRAGRRRI